MESSNSSDDIADDKNEFLLNLGLSPPADQSRHRTPERETEDAGKVTYYIDAMGQVLPISTAPLDSFATAQSNFEPQLWHGQAVGTAAVGFYPPPSPYTPAVSAATQSWLDSTDTTLASPTWQPSPNAELPFATADFLSLYTSSPPYAASLHTPSLASSPMGLAPSSLTSPRSTNLTSPPDTGPPPKKKRGRPIKNDLTTTQVATPSRRGRPPKGMPIDALTAAMRPPAPSRRQSSASAGTSSSTSAIDPTEGRLARNRLAATKCRAKAQAMATQLEADELEARDTNRRLSASRHELHNEVLALRTELLRHANCNCPLMQRYLAERARFIAG